MQQVIQIQELPRRVGPGADLGADYVDPLHHLAIEIGVAPHGIVNTLAPFQQARQDIVDIADGEGIVGAVVGHRPLRSGAVTVPLLHGRIAVAAEQDILAVTTAG